VCFELQVIDLVPREEHDQPMDALLTETGIRRFVRP
jgi:5-formyltetrahydrofolate cyclo-ligase